MVDDFTEARYVELLHLAGRRFRYMSYHNCHDGENLLLWRHDVDISPQRALRLAAIEAKHGSHATYFFQLTSNFYNLMETGITRLIKEIHTLGHEVGLHFDPHCHGVRNEEAFCRALSFEAGILEHLLAAPVRVFSLHTPTLVREIDTSRRNYAGLINASARFFSEQYTYCSDSNGYWRYTPLAELLADESVSRVHALTHPCWWQRQAMSPREKVARSIDGRARGCGESYDALLKENGRVNLGLLC